MVNGTNTTDPNYAYDPNTKVPYVCSGGPGYNLFDLKFERENYTYTCDVNPEKCTVCAQCCKDYLMSSKIDCKQCADDNCPKRPQEYNKNEYPYGPQSDQVIA